MEKLPIFTSHYSFSKSILTLEKAGTSKETGADSIIDIALKSNIKDVYLVEDNLSSFIEAYENCNSAGLNLRYGLRLTMTNDASKKDEDSLKSNHKLIIWAKSSKGYFDLTKIYSKAFCEGKYYTGRSDFNILKLLWTNDLLLTIPFYDSFIFENNLKNHKCIPDFSFTKPIFFLENNDLPFDSVMRELVIDFVKKNNYKVEEVRSIFYNKTEDFKAYLTFRCINKRSCLSSPKLDHFSSDTFSLEHYLNE